MARPLPIGMLLASMIFFAFAVWDYWALADSPGVFIVRPEREFSGVKAKEDIELLFSIHNPTRHPVRVTNVAAVC